MKEFVLIHIPHSSLYIPKDYKRLSLIGEEELEAENLFMCDFNVDNLLENKSNAIIFPYSRLYCDVERFKGNEEVMNKFGMGYIYTKTSMGKNMFSPNDYQRKIITNIYDNHHRLLDDKVTQILNKYNKCIIIDLHSYSSELTYRLFGYEKVPDICIGVEPLYYSDELVNHFVSYFEKYGYETKINYPYSGSLVPNKFYNKKNTGIVSIMIEINKRIYEDDFENFKRIFLNSLEF